MTDRHSPTQQDQRQRRPGAGRPARPERPHSRQRHHRGVRASRPAVLAVQDEGGRAVRELLGDRGEERDQDSPGPDRCVGGRRVLRRLPSVRRGEEQAQAGRRAEGGGGGSMPGRRNRKPGLTPPQTVPAPRPLQCHKAKNLSTQKGGHCACSSKAARAVVDLQDLLPMARVVYCSATGVSEPRNMVSSPERGGQGLEKAMHTQQASPVCRRASPARHSPPALHPFRRPT